MCGSAIAHTALSDPRWPGPTPMPEITCALHLRRGISLYDQRDRVPARRVPATDQDQTVLPAAETGRMPFCALRVAGQIIMGKVDVSETLAEPLSDQIISLVA